MTKTLVQGLCSRAAAGGSGDGAAVVSGMGWAYPRSGISMGDWVSLVIALLCNLQRHRRSSDDVDRPSYPCSLELVNQR